MDILDDTIAVLNGLGFDANLIQTDKSFRALHAERDSIRAYFVWRESDGDLIFQIARIWEYETHMPLGAYPNVTDAVAAATHATT